MVLDLRFVSLAASMTMYERETIPFSQRIVCHRRFGLLCPAPDLSESEYWRRAGRTTDQTGALSTNFHIDNGDFFHHGMAQVVPRAASMQR